MFSGLGDYINPRPFMNALFAELNAMVPQLDLGTFTNIAFATTMGWVAVTILAVVLGLAVWYSQQRMKSKKFSWWVPIVAAIVANVLATACIGLAIFSDPAFQEGLANLSRQG